jgi:hypothetical protein
VNDNEGPPVPSRRHTHRRPGAGSTWGRTVAAAGVGAVTGVIAVASYSVLAEDPQQPAAAPVSGIAIAAAPQSVPAAQEQTVTQTGRVTAISAGWVTAQSSDGYTQTYRIAPDTTAVPTPADGHAPVGEQFAVDQVVTIVATVSDGTATATAMAEQAATGSNGLPQDYALP